MTSGEIRSDERRFRKIAGSRARKNGTGDRKAVTERRKALRGADDAMFEKHRAHRGTTKSRLSALRSLFDEGMTFQGKCEFGALRGAETMTLG